MATPDAASTKTTSWAPTAKVSAGALAGSAATLAAVLLKNYFKNKGLEFSPEIGGAITSIVTFIVQYMVPERWRPDPNVGHPWATSRARASLCVGVSPQG